MKKLLSLLLALVMALSLITIPAAAEEFTDDGDITYQEAVDVMLAVDVIGGYENGSFKPTGSLTRGAAAKIICNMVLGPTTAGALVADAAPFADVPANHTFAPYIAYVAGEGIVNGYADGSFRPAGTLTGYAFMKMLLGALGYDAAVEGYTGDNWSINVAKQGLHLKLTEGLEGEFEGNEMIDRQTAMLLAFNAMQTEMVKYDGKSTVSVGSITVDAVSEATGTGMSFMQKYFNKLEKTENLHDPMGRPATRWMLDGKEIGLYAKAYDNFYLDTVSAQTLYKELGLTDTLPSASIDYYVDGVLGATGYRTFTNIGKKGTGCAGEQGVLTEIYWDDDAQKLTVLEINTYFGEIISVGEDEDGRYVSVAGMDMRAYNGDFYTDSFDIGDRVIYTVSQQEDEIVDMELANTMVVTVTKVVSTGKFVADAKIWTNHKELALQPEKMINNDADHPERPVSVGNTVKIWLNHYNYVIWAERQSSTVSNLGVVLGVAKESDVYGNDTYMAKLLRLDGKVEELQISNYTYAGWKANALGVDPLLFRTTADKSNPANDIYYLSGTESDARTVLAGNLVDCVYATETGNYKLDLKSVSSAGKVNIETGIAKMTIRNVVRYADNNTVFLVETGTAAEPVYTAYTGFKNVPNIKGSNLTALVYCPLGSTVADVVYVKADNISTGGNDYIYVHGAGVSGKNTDANGDSWTYPAVIDGKAATVKVNAPMDGNQMYTELAYDQNGLVELDTSALYLYNTDNSKDDYAMKALVTEKFKDDIIMLNGEGYTVADDADVWCVTDNSGLNKADTISAASIKNVEAGAAVRVIMVDGEVKVLVYCVDAANGKQTVTTPDSDDSTTPPPASGSGGYDVDSDTDTMSLDSMDRKSGDVTKLVVNAVVPTNITRGQKVNWSITVEDGAAPVAAGSGTYTGPFRGAAAGTVLPLEIALQGGNTDSRALAGEYIVRVTFAYNGGSTYTCSEKLTLAADPSYTPPAEEDTTVVYAAEKWPAPGGAAEAAGSLMVVDSVYRPDLGAPDGAVVISVVNPTGEEIPIDTTYYSVTLWDCVTGKVVGGTKSANATRPTVVGATGNYACIVYFNAGANQEVGGLYRVKIDLRMDKTENYSGEWYTVTTFVDAT